MNRTVAALLAALGCGATALAAQDAGSRFRTTPTIGVVKFDKTSALSDLDGSKLWASAGLTASYLVGGGFRAGVYLEFQQPQHFLARGRMPAARAAPRIATEVLVHNERIPLHVALLVVRSRSKRFRRNERRIAILRHCGKRQRQPQPRTLPAPAHQFSFPFLRNQASSAARHSPPPLQPPASRLTAFVTQVTQNGAHR